MIAAGHRLGPYEIGPLLGSGGMGHVYRARDTKLGRDVAIKILPDAFTADADRRARFEREARLLAALNHPHIGAIYGFEERDGVHALVLELIEGQTLAERLRAGALTVDETVAIARQVASALEAAHDKGIVHRDLKPANIAITPDGVAKVLDFGLATTRAVDSPGDVVDSALTTSGTRDGVILGTFPYMSPEQARGKTVDKRTDIWALGCVIYEMLTGRRAFAGDTASDTIAAILEREPDWRLLPEATPPTLRRLIRRCLEKDPKRRLHDSADVRIEIEDALAPAPRSAAATTPSGVRRGRLALLILASLLAIALVAGLLIWQAIAPAPTGVTRFTITLPPNITLRDPMALSPDGRTLVYTGVDADGSRLYRRTLDALESVVIRGTEGGGRPFLSPDGTSIGFVGNHVLKRVPLQGGAPVTMAEFHVDHSATWLSDDTIVFGLPNRGLMRVPAAGGDARQITVVDRARGEIEHHSPVGIPGGRALLFTVHTGARDAQRIDALSLESGRRVSLIHGSGPYLLPTGHIAFAYQRSGALWVAPFDAARLQVTAPPTAVLEDVAISDGWVPTIAVAANGSLAYAMGQAEFASYTPRRLVWVDRTGKEEAIDAPARAWAWPQISPDGNRLGLHIHDPVNMDAWIYELDHGPLTRVTYHPLQDGSPLWTPDGKRIAFWSRQGSGVGELFMRAADLTGADEQLTRSQNAQLPFAWADGGKLLVFQESSRETRADIGIVPIDGEHTARILIRGPADEARPSMSADGRWIAYQSNQSGRWEVYVQPFPELDSRWQVSTQGGVSPVWHPNGRELFYRNGRSVMSVPVTVNGRTFTPGSARILFEGSFVPESLETNSARSYTVSPDGARFLMMKDAPPLPGTAGGTQIVVIENWSEELKRLVAEKR